MSKQQTIEGQISLFEDQQAETDLDMDWDSVFSSEIVVENTESIPDALIKCLNARGKVDIEYIEEITGREKKDIISALRGSIFQNPDKWEECYYKGWETADEYLSGNLIKKWEKARIADETYKGIFKANTEAIIDAMPPSVNYEDIYITLGSPWIPTDIIDDFIRCLFPYKTSVVKKISRDFYGDLDSGLAQLMGVRHNELTSAWEIPHKSYYMKSYANRHRYGTDKINGINILEKTLNLKEAIIYKEVEGDTKSGKKYVIDEEETLLALEKQQALRQEFQDWVWKDIIRKARLEEIYESKFSCIKKRVFNGSFLELPDLSESISLYPYQKDAVARIIFTPNTLLAHDVGSGKTLVMIAAGHELKRIGISRKNMYVVPNNIVGQWKTMFEDMYPGSRVLTVEPGNFTSGKREIILERIRDEEYDGIIIASSCFDMIKVSKKMRIRFLEQKKKELSDSQRKLTNQVNSVKTRITNLAKKIEDMKNEPEEDGIFFDDLGITRLFVDEAHYYKNVPITTKLEYAPSINIIGSEKCASMLEKTRTVLMQDSSGVIMATGTPIANSITDVFTFQQYLQYGEMKLLGLNSFDSWLGMFAEKKTGFEIDVDTTKYRMATRFSKFHNLPELTNLFGEIADFHNMDKTADIPDFDGYEDIVVGRSPQFDRFLGTISERADRVRKGVVSRTEDNMLKITVDGRKGALDLRLVSKDKELVTKSDLCARKIADIYFAGQDDLMTQLVFCDISVSQSNFNIYDELKVKLIGFGIPEKDIAYVHEAKNAKEREVLFEKVRQGEIRILLGSTFKLGLGVNIQDHLYALHHLDVPWRPADMVQREGRILRQGNTNSKVHIYRYVKEGSFDAYSWQLLETKQRFISEILSGMITKRSGSDIEDTVLDYAEIKALAIGDPKIKERVDVSNELSRLITLRRKYTENRMMIEAEQLKIPISIRKLRERLEKIVKDKAFVDSSEDSAEALDKKDHSEHRKNIRETIDKVVLGSFMRSTDREVMIYRGFKLIVPSYMQYDKPRILLIREDTYNVELNNSGVGNLVRIDNAIDGLGRRIDDVMEELAEHERRYIDNEKALEEKESFSDDIKMLEEKLKKIDKGLGVKK